MTRAARRLARLARMGTSIGIPKGIFTALRRHPHAVRVAPILLTASYLRPGESLSSLKTRVVSIGRCNTI
jgi:hypothetical protein